MLANSFRLNNHFVAGLAESEDIRHLQEIAQTVFREHFAPIIRQAQVEYMLLKFYGTESLQEKMNKGERYYIVAQSDEENMGIAGFFSITPDYEKKTVQLNKFFLLKPFRGQGIGSARWKLLKEAAQKAGMTKFWLAINRRNPSVKIYQALGFTIAREENFDIGEGFVMDDYIMEQTIA